MQQVYFKDLGQMGYKAAWDYQEGVAARQCRMQVV